MTGSTSTRVVASVDGVEVRLRPRFLLKAVMLSTVLGGFFGWGGWALTDGELSWRAWCWCLAALALSPLPDLVRALRRRPRVRITSLGLEYHGWCVDAHVDWSDVDHVVLDTTIRSRPALSLRTRAHPTSYRWRRTRLLLPIERNVTPGRIDIPVICLDHPVRVLVCLQWLNDAPLEDRSGFLAGTALWWLCGVAPPR